jgi:hypothetical protein
MNAQGKVTKVTRHKNTTYGNPMYSIELDGVGTFKTPANAGWVYGINWFNLIDKLVYVEASKPRTNWIMKDFRVEG